MRPADVIAPSTPRGVGGVVFYPLGCEAAQRDGPQVE